MGGGNDGGARECGCGWEGARGVQKDLIKSHSITVDVFCPLAIINAFISPVFRLPRNNNSAKMNRANRIVLPIERFSHSPPLSTIHS